MQLTSFFQTNMALGSDVTLVLVSTPSSQAEIDVLFKRLWRYIYAFERRFSRFLPQSELSTFNRLGGVRHPISPQFRDLLKAASEFSSMTDELYNPFILPALQRAGYTQSFVPKYADDLQENYSNRIVVPASELKIGADWAHIPYGTALDLGGCGKGYLADRLTEILPDHIAGYWFSLGGDIAVGGINEDGSAWDVHVDTTPWVVQYNRKTYGVATSGVSLRKGIHHNREWHHIIDPRTQLPSTTDIAMATVLCKTAAEADVLASCAVLLGSKQAWPFLKARGVISALLQIVVNETIHYKSYGRAIHKVQQKGASHA